MSFMLIGGFRFIAGHRFSIGVPVVSLLIGLTAAAVFIAGRWVKRGPETVRKLYRALFSRRPKLALAWTACLALGGLAGISSNHQRTSACRSAIDAIDLRSATFDQVASALITARALCVSAEATTQLAELDERLAAARKAECTKRVAQAGSLSPAKLPAEQALAKLNESKLAAITSIEVCTAAGMSTEVRALEAMVAEIDRQVIVAKGAVQLAAQEEKERQAVANFPTRSASIRTKLASAMQSTNQGRWAGAGSDLDDAESMLGEFTNTSVASTPVWSSFAKQLNVQRARVQPQLARIRRQEETVRAAEQLTEKTRGTAPQMSGWNGACIACKDYLKQAMNDPDSFDHVRSSVPQIEGAYWSVVMVFRGKNAFGATIMNAKKFYIQSDQVVRMTDG